MAEFQGVTAVTWGPWRAEFLGEPEAPIVRVRTHQHKGIPSEIVADVPTDDPTEAGLRTVLMTLAQDTKVADIVDQLEAANPAWSSRVGVKKPLEEAARRPMRATKKTTARKTKKR